MMSYIWMDGWSGQGAHEDWPIRLSNPLYFNHVDKRKHVPPKRRYTTTNYMVQ
jgi:hypothetical protein